MRIKTLLTGALVGAGLIFGQAAQAQEKDRKSVV